MILGFPRSVLFRIIAFPFDEVPHLNLPSREYAIPQLRQVNYIFEIRSVIVDSFDNESARDTIRSVEI